MNTYDRLCKITSELFPLAMKPLRSDHLGTWGKVVKLRSVHITDVLTLILYRVYRQTIQYNTIQYNTVQYNTIQYNTIKLVTFTVHFFATS